MPAKPLRLPSAGTLRFRFGRRENVRHWRTAPPNEGEARVKAYIHGGAAKAAWRILYKFQEVNKEIK